jgi:GT2 family glycosyltransferase
VVDPHALSAVVARMETDPRIGLCGSLLLYYDAPDVVQVAGGATFNRATAIPAGVASGVSRDRVPPTQAVERAMTFVVGASVLVTNAFICTVGGMTEDYFLYYEEIDWFMRAKGRFRLGFARDSIVYHKEGGSAGSSTNWRTRSEISDLCAVRSRLVFTRRFHKAWYPLVFATIVGAFLKRIARRQPRRALEVLRILISPERYRIVGAGGGAVHPHVEHALRERSVAAHEEEERESGLDDEHLRREERCQAVDRRSET